MIKNIQVLGIKTGDNECNPYSNDEIIINGDHTLTGNVDFIAVTSIILPAIGSKDISPSNGLSVKFRFTGDITPNGHSITLFGVDITSTPTDSKIYDCFYYNSTWHVQAITSSNV